MAKGNYRQEGSWINRWEKLTGYRPNESLAGHCGRHNSYYSNHCQSIRDSAAALRSQRFLSTWNEVTGNAEEQETNET